MSSAPEVDGSSQSLKTLFRVELSVGPERRGAAGVDQSYGPAGGGQC